MKTEEQLKEYFINKYIEYQEDLLELATECPAFDCAELLVKIKYFCQEVWRTYADLFLDGDIEAAIYELEENYANWIEEQENVEIETETDSKIIA